jgi:hypothetical protein
VKDDQMHTRGLWGDHGLNDADDVTWGGLGSMFLVAAGCAYFASIWLVSGLAPLPMLVSRLREGSTGRTGVASAERLPSMTSQTGKPA